MRINRIKIVNFRNFKDFEVLLAHKNVVIVGENNVGKSNLLYALRLVLDPSLPNSARRLDATDFWEGLDKPFGGHEIRITVGFTDFAQNIMEQASLADCLSGDPDNPIAAISYIYGPVNGKDTDDPSSLTEDDYDFYFCCDEQPDRKVRELAFQKFMPLEVLQTLRNAAADLETWQRSPLSRLIKRLKPQIDLEALGELSNEIDEKIKDILDLPPIATLQRNIVKKLEDIAGQSEPVDPRLAFLPTDPDRLLQFLRLFADGEILRRFGDIGTGYANIMYLVLLLLDFQGKLDVSEQAAMILAVEEPEAHLHPHLQRLVFGYLFNKIQNEFPVFISTHSPHITSVAPLSGLLVLKHHNSETIGKTIATSGLLDPEVTDLERYLDVTRAELVFSRGVILVEGIVEVILVNEFAVKLGISLDTLGISVISVYGTDFIPYVKLLGGNGLDIPTVIITDGDPIERNGSSICAGIERGKKIYNTIYSDDGTFEGLSEADVKLILAEAGIFVGEHTIEIDMVNAGYGEEFLEVFTELGEGPKSINNTKQALIDWPNLSTKEKHTKIVEKINNVCGKGRFAQRLASKLDRDRIPPYISQALAFMGVPLNVVDAPH